MTMEHIKNETVIVGGISKMLVQKIEKMIDEHGINNLKKLGYGAFGIVYALGNYAIKIYAGCFNEDEESNWDAVNLLKLQGKDSPFLKLYAYHHKKFMIYERVMTKNLSTYNYQSPILHSLDLKKGFAEHYMNCLRYAFERGLLPFDAKTDNVMIKNGLPVIVDVGNFLENGGTFYGETYSYKTFEDFFADRRFDNKLNEKKVKEFYQNHVSKGYSIKETHDTLKEFVM
jgi:serine/threonine protein kinase